MNGTDSMQEPQEAPPALPATKESGASLEDPEEASKLAKLTRAESAAEDVEKASAVSDEAGPLGFLITAAAAAATQLIGRKIKAHTMQTEGHFIPLGYTSTVGA